MRSIYLKLPRSLLSFSSPSLWGSGNFHQPSNFPKHGLDHDMVTSSCTVVKLIWPVTPRPDGFSIGLPLSGIYSGPAPADAQCDSEISSWMPYALFDSTPNGGGDTQVLLGGGSNFELTTMHRLPFPPYCFVTSPTFRGSFLPDWTRRVTH